jgi:serine/threonine protein kinase
MNNVNPLLESMIRKIMNKNPIERPTTSQLLSDPLFANIKK